MTNLIASIIMTIVVNGETYTVTNYVTPKPITYWATNWTTNAPYMGWTLTNNSFYFPSSNNYRAFIKQWASEGKVCEVLGHNWQRGCSFGPGCNVLHGGGEMRHCAVCKHEESRSAW